MEDAAVQPEPTPPSKPTAVMSPGAKGGGAAETARGGAADRLRLQVAEHVASQLPAKLDPDLLRSKALRLHDPVWGTLVLQPHEVALLDTPLLQRLRRVKQLSGASLIFPGALHTRFEHTLGVAHLAGKMCSGLNENPSSHRQVGLAQANAIRYAALCHDLGHGPFSHSSEKCITELGPMPELIADGRNLASGGAETLSIMVVQSEPMRQFLAEVGEIFEVELDVDSIAKAISGGLDGASHHLGEIIHGPFDADKLDYLARDGHFCGIPLRPDSEKIYSTLEMGLHEGRSRLVCGSKAAAALLQIVHHKQHMFFVVYQHHVMRIFTLMLRCAFDCAIEDGTPINGKALASPVDLLALDDEMLLTPGVVAPGRAADLLARLRNRELYKVAIAFGPRKRRMIEGNEENLREQIAARARVAKHEVLIDVARRIGNAEARSALVRIEDGVRPLGTIMPHLESDGVELFNQLESHLVLCPPHAVEAVRGSAQHLLGDLV